MFVLPSKGFEYIHKKSLKTPNVYSQAVIRRRIDNVMAKKKKDRRKPMITEK
jgi:hypothetical protein